MTTRKPKVGDAAIIDGGPAVITAVSPTSIEFKCPERVERDARIAELRAMPRGTEGEEAAANAAKEEFMAEHQAKLDAVGDADYRKLLANHGHALPGGTVMVASPGQVFWVEFSKAWAANGRLLPRADVVETEVVDGRVREVKNKKGEPVITEPSVRREAKLFRKQGQDYNPLREVAAHIAHVSQTGG